MQNKAVSNHGSDEWPAALVLKGIHQKWCCMFGHYQTELHDDPPFIAVCQASKLLFHGHLPNFRYGPACIYTQLSINL